MWYSINYNILAIQLLPTFLRKNRIISFLKVLILPIDRLYYQWFMFRKDNLYKLAHTGQVCYLRKVLNDRFDPSQRRIYIGNGNKYTRSYIYTHAENKPQFLSVAGVVGSIGIIGGDKAASLQGDIMYLHQRSDYADTGIDFIVYAPVGLLDVHNYEMKALINFYKEGVKQYKIEEI